MYKRIALTIVTLVLAGPRCSNYSTLGFPSMEQELACMHRYALDQLAEDISQAGPNGIGGVLILGHQWEAWLEINQCY